MKIIRKYQDLNQYFKSHKVLVIYGPRQVGKTTLITDFFNSTTLKYKYETGENVRIQQLFSSLNLKEILEYASNYELIAIDEAQNIPDIGKALKLLVDNCPEIKLVATGSSSFELSGQVGEPLTGRKITLRLYPISLSELTNLYNTYEIKEKIPELLVYGCYPEILTTESFKEKRALLDELVHSSLLKDVFVLERVKDPKAILDLLRLLAFQIGSEVSLNELASQLHIDVKTVQRYLNLLENAFIIVGLTGYSRNLRNEMTKKKKYYFYDTGIRNGIISNFNPITLRNDVGSLWENFVIIERMKKREYDSIYANQYFWRTWNQNEIDLIEERDGKIFGYECKWSETKKLKAPTEWSKGYPKAEYLVINQDNFLEFLV